MSETAAEQKRNTSKIGDPVASYKELMMVVREQGLLERCRAFYITTFSILMLALAGAAFGFILLGDSWFQLLVAAGLGVIFTQLAFLGHEAAHRQVFASGPANDRVGRVLANLIVGISYSWWTTKHTRHHGNPNLIGKDPDIDMKVLSFEEESAAKKKGIGAFWTRRQGYFFFPLLLLEGLNLNIVAWRTVLGRGKVQKRGQETGMLSIRTVAFLGVIFALLPVGLALAFIGVQLAVFGLYMGASFAPNHKGMPILPRGSKVDFLSKQVMTSRNIRGGAAMRQFMGGLNYQIEHHLFPSMPRPHLPKARRIVRRYCRELDITYTETSLTKSYGIVIRYLNRVGLAARDPFDCPWAHYFRPR